MTVRELSVELGVAAVYMEDEVALLEKYGCSPRCRAGNTKPRW